MNKFKNGILWVIYPTNVKIPLATMKSENIVSYNVKWVDLLLVGKHWTMFK